MYAFPPCARTGRTYTFHLPDGPLDVPCADETVAIELARRIVDALKLWDIAVTGPNGLTWRVG